MPATCPNGHGSPDDDYCSECGAAIGAGPPSGPACPVCGAHQSLPDGKYCEECGHEMARPAPAAAPAPAGWTALVRADRDWFDEVRSHPEASAHDVEFPEHYPERRFELSGPQLVIGRRSRRRGTDPELDLGSRDVGVSALHAMLLQAADGTWEVVDLESTNGTQVGDDPLTPNRPAPLRSGDRIKLGFWTTITMCDERPPG